MILYNILFNLNLPYRNRTDFMASVNFLYRSVKPETFLNLRLLFRHRSMDNVIGCKTQLKVSKDYWENIHNRKRIKDIDILEKQNEIKKELSKIEGFILNAFLRSNPDFVNKDWLESQLALYYNPVQASQGLPEKLTEYIDYYASIKLNEIKPASRVKFNVIKNKLLRMEKATGSLILIQNIDESFKNAFVQYCVIQKYSWNTIQRELGLIKTFCKHARSNGLKVSTQLDSLRLKKEKVNHIYLSLDEIEIIEKLKLNQESLDNARDWLVMSCFLGQRISDFMDFNKSLIRYEEEKPLIEFTQKKTGKLMTVPLHSKVISLLNKRNGDFPRKLSHQRYNDFIKEVCKKAQLNNIVTGKKQINVGGKKPDKRAIRNVQGKITNTRISTIKTL